VHRVHVVAANRPWLLTVADVGWGCNSTVLIDPCLCRPNSHCATSTSWIDQISDLDVSSTMSQPCFGSPIARSGPSIQLLPGRQRTTQDPSPLFLVNVREFKFGHCIYECRRVASPTRLASSLLFFVLLRAWHMNTSKRVSLGLVLHRF